MISFLFNGRWLRIVTGQAVTTDYVISYDLISVERTAALEITGSVNTATNRDALGTNDTSPVFNTRVHSIRITNSHASTTQTVQLGIYTVSGATFIPFTPVISIPAGHTLVLEEGSQYVAAPSGGVLPVVTTTRKMLGQSAPSATTETDLYTVPAGKTAKCGMLMACNRGAAAATFRVSVSVGGGATANKDYIYYDLTIAAYDSFLLDLLNGMNLAATDKVRVYASSGDMSFNLNGEEYA